MENYKPIDIADLYPEFTKQELVEAEENLRRYIAALLRISDRLQSEGRSLDYLVDGLFDDSRDQR